MPRKPCLLVVIFLGTIQAFAQVPVIQKVEPLNAHPNDTILLTGSGFTPGSMDVWFGQAKGTVIGASEFAIEVRVPPQARLENVEVINRSSSLSAKANLKFTPSFSGAPFDVSRINTTVVEGVNKFSSSNELWDISTTDLDLDGKPDIVASKFESSVPFAGATDIMILKNTSTPGTLAFTKFEKNNLPALNLNFPTDNVVTSDLQGDGKPEIVVSRAGSTRNSIHILRNTSTVGTISFATPNITLGLDAGHVATRMRVRDLNKDGKPEIIVSNTFNDVVYIFINQSTGGTNISFNPTPVKLSVRVFATDASSTNYEVEVQDFNGDDLPDLVVNEFQEDSIHVFRNTSAGSVSFAPKNTIPTTEKLNRLAAVDVNKDGKLDLVATSTLNSQVLVYLNQSSGNSITFPSSATVLASGSGSWGVDVADIDGDGDPDLVNANRAEAQITVFTHDGNFTTPAFTRHNITTGTDTRNVKLADMDGDGKPDVVYTAFNADGIPTSSVEILRNANCHSPVITNTPVPVEICNGRTVVLTALNAINVTYTWEKDNVVIPGETTPYLTVNMPNAEGSYTVIATEGTCSVESAPVEMIENTGSAPAVPDINVAQNPLCTGADIQLSTSVAGAQYFWTGPNNFTSNVQNPTIPDATDANAGFYNLDVIVGDCRSNLATVRVDIADLADFAITSNNPTNTLCAGGSLTLSVSNLANHTYQWKKDGVNVSPGGTTSSLVVSAEGDYTVDVTNTTLNCTREIGPVSVIVLAVPVAAYQVDATACENEDITFTNESTVDSRATVVYNWNFGDGDTDQTESPVKAYAAANTYNTSLTVSYSGVTGCTDNETAQVVITESVQPVINSDVTAVCPDGPATLSVAGTFATIVWSTTATSPSIEVSGPGTYTVTTTDANGCPGTDDIIIDAKEIPVLTVTANRTSIAGGDTTMLHVTGALTYLWSPAETLSAPESPDPIAEPVQTTTYTVVGTNADECTAEGSITITVEGVLGFPAMFSPNGDGTNDEWNIRAQDKPDCTINIFDGKGRRIFEARGQNWDGTHQGKAVPNGTYYYVFGCPTEKPITGTVLIVR